MCLYFGLFLLIIRLYMTKELHQSVWTNSEASAALWNQHLSDLTCVKVAHTNKTALSAFKKQTENKGQWQLFFPGDSELVKILEAG